MSLFSSLVAEVEKASIAAVTAYIENSSLGVEEKAAVSAVLAAYNSPSMTSALTAFEDVIKVIADLKAQIIPSQPEPSLAGAEQTAGDGPTS